MMAPAAAYDEIADWYEQEFLPSTAAAGADPLGIGAALDGLLGSAAVSAWRSARHRCPCEPAEAASCTDRKPDHNTGANVLKPDARAAETDSSVRKEGQVMTTASPLSPYSSRSDKQFPSRSGKQAASSVSSRSAAKPDTAVPPAPEVQDQPEASPAAPVRSTAAVAAAAPVAAARRVLATKGGLPLYAGLGGLALAGIIDWPVALAAGTGYGLARFWASLDQQQQPVPARPAG
jgi:hypothetical protein